MMKVKKTNVAWGVVDKTGFIPVACIRRTRLEVKRLMDHDGMTREGDRIVKIELAVAKGAKGATK